MMPSVGSILGNSRLNGTARRSLGIAARNKAVASCEGTEPMPTLYVVGTPIGNLEDVTLRALRVLGEVGLIAAEDTRVTRKLLDRYAIRTPLTSYGDHNKVSKLPQLLDALANVDVAVVSDAGMPGVNDPGQELVSAALTAGFHAVPVPGPSALTAAIAVSGLPVGQFFYLGFMPRKRVERRRLLGEAAASSRTVVAFETRYRLKASLEDVLDVLGDRRITICRELTKLHEEIFRGAVSEALTHFEAPRGEFTLVIEGVIEGRGHVESETRDQARVLASQLRQARIGVQEAIARIIVQSGLSRREAYALWLEAEVSGSPPK